MKQRIQEDEDNLEEEDDKYIVLPKLKEMIRRKIDKRKYDKRRNN